MIGESGNKILQEVAESLKKQLKKHNLIYHPTEPCRVLKKAPCKDLPVCLSYPSNLLTDEKCQEKPNLAYYTILYRGA